MFFCVLLKRKRQPHVKLQIHLLRRFDPWWTCLCFVRALTADAVSGDFSDCFAVSIHFRLHYLS